MENTMDNAMMTEEYWEEQEALAGMEALLTLAEKARKQESDEYHRRDKQRRQEEAKQAVLTLVGKGDRVRVCRGRKVPVGTTGLIIWEGLSAYGTRFGVKDDAGTVHWVASHNVEREDADHLRATVTCWIACYDALNEQKALANRLVAESFPAKGCIVRTQCGKQGSVFWKSGDGKRVGVRVGPNRDDVVWADACTVSQ